MQLKFIGVCVNRLSGEIPKELGNFTSLTKLDLEANQFSGAVPSDLGKLVNLKELLLSSNRLSGNLPAELAGLRNLTDFRINDNNFNGTIPDFIQNWTQLERLEMHASGLKGPIPSSISVLVKLTQLRISDINGSSQDFPVLSNMTGLKYIVLRNCNISGKIPPYIWELTNLRLLFLSGNMLSGNIPESILKKGTTVDLSYNDFTWQSPEQPACQPNLDLDLNLFRSSSRGGVLPCIKDFKCPRQWHSLYVNAGGDNVAVKRNKGDIVYEGDAGIDRGAARYNFSETTNWGLSSTGDFMDDNNVQDKSYIVDLPSSNIPYLYTTARRSPISLAYYRYCFENGSYKVNLHFAEIQFTNDSTSGSLGRRMFDIYIQDKLVQKDFNIADEARGFVKPLVKPFNATVTNNILEIRFYWAGKGTTRIPERGVYGPLISAISVDPNFIPRSEDEKKMIVPIVVGVVGFSLVFLASVFLWWRRYMRAKDGKQKGYQLQT